MIVPTITEIKDDLREELISRHPKIRNFSAGSMLDVLTEIIAIQVNLMFHRIS